jgi:hypothetical protein
MSNTLLNLSSLSWLDMKRFPRELAFCTQLMLLASSLSLSFGAPCLNLVTVLFFCQRRKVYDIIAILNFASRVADMGCYLIFWHCY